MFFFSSFSCTVQVQVLDAKLRGGGLAASKAEIQGRDPRQTDFTVTDKAVGCKHQCSF